MLHNTTNPALSVRLPNWVGDVCMALPALQAMQAAGLQLHLFGKPWINALLAATDWRLTTLPNSFWSSTQTMRREANNHLLLLTNSFSSALMARMAGKRPIGYTSDSRRLLLSAGITKKPHEHEVTYFLNIARFAVEHWFPTHPWPSPIASPITLPITEAFKINAHQALQTAGVSTPFIVLCPFAQGTGMQHQPKIWPHWKALSNRLSDHTLVVCPAPHEVAACEALVPNAGMLPGLNLGEYAAVLALATAVIANDSGPMHLAAAVGAPTLGLFGVTSPHRTSPWGGDYLGALGTWPTLNEVMEWMSAPSFKDTTPRL